MKSGLPDYKVGMVKYQLRCLISRGKMTVHSEEAQVNISKGGDPDLFNVVSKY
jgi:hypothetical protein